MYGFSDCILTTRTFDLESSVNVTNKKKIMEKSLIV